MNAQAALAEALCPCCCRPNDEPCGEPLRGIERSYGECILCHEGEHWEPGDDDPAFDWPAIFDAVARSTE